MKYLRKLPNVLFIIIIGLLTSCDKQPVVKSNSEIVAKKVGVIEFGENWEEVNPETNNGRGVKIVKPKNQFQPNDTLAWVAMSEEPFGKTVLDVMWVKVSVEGSETVIYKEEHLISDPAKFKIAFGKLDYCGSRLGNESGKYKLKYFRDSTLLAEGEFLFKADNLNSPTEAANLTSPTEFDGRVGKFAYMNDSKTIVTVKLYHPQNPGKTHYTQQVSAGANQFIGDFSIGNDWGVQVDNSRICSVGQVSDWYSDKRIFNSGNGRCQ